MISIVDCGMGNLGSVCNILKHIGSAAKVITTPDEVQKATKLILPGVGNWDNGARRIMESGLRESLDAKVLKEKIPVLGICLGMQLLSDSSEEGPLQGLGWIPGRVRKFSDIVLEQGLKIPHMGWNKVNVCKDNPLLKNFSEDSRFYFVHSYHIECDNKAHEILSCQYGYDFVCAVNKDNIWGVQFHPEKSHRFGMTLMKNFSEL